MTLSCKTGVAEWTQKKRKKKNYKRQSLSADALARSMLSRDKSAFPSPFASSRNAGGPPKTRLASRWDEWHLKMLECSQPSFGVESVVQYQCGNADTEWEYWLHQRRNAILAGRFMSIQDGPLQRGGCCVVSRDGLRYQPQKTSTWNPKKTGTFLGGDSGSVGSLANVRQAKLQTCSKSNSRGLPEM